MGTPEHENFTRLILILTGPAKKGLIELLVTTVVGLAPEDSQTGSFTVDKLLLQNKQKLLEYFSAESLYLNILFPGLDIPTDLDQWDFKLTTSILTQFCNLTEIRQSDVKTVSDVWDRLSEAMQPVLHEDTFIQYVNLVKDSSSRILETVSNKELRKSVLSEVDEIINAPVHVQIEKQKDEWCVMDGGEQSQMDDGASSETIQTENPAGEAVDGMDAISSSLKGVGEPELDDRANKRVIDEEQLEILSQLRQIIEQHPTADLELIIPGSKVIILVHHHDEHKVSEFLVKKFKTVLAHIEEERQAGVGSVVNNALRRLLNGDQDVTVAQKECVALYIQCQTIIALVSLCEDCINGKLTQNFKPIEREVRKIEGFETVELEVVMYEEDFWDTIRKLVNDMKTIYLDEGGRLVAAQRPYQNPMSRIRKPVTVKKPAHGGFSLGFTISSRTEEEAHAFAESIRKGEKQQIFTELTEVLRKEFNMPNLELNVHLANDDDADDKEADIDDEPLDNVDATMEPITPESNNEGTEDKTETVTMKETEATTEPTIPASIDEVTDYKTEHVTMEEIESDTQETENRLQTEESEAKAMSDIATTDDVTEGMDADMEAAGYDVPESN